MAADKELIARLLRKRVVVLGAEVTSDLAMAVIAQMLFLQSEDRAAEIKLAIDSPGGLCTASLAILDAMASLHPPVSTRAIGQANGTASLLLAAGRAGRRFAVPHARIALLPTRAASGAEGRESEILRLNAEIRDGLARHTGRDVTVIAAAMERSLVLTSAEARHFGIIDRIFGPGEGVWN